MQLVRKIKNSPMVMLCSSCVHESVGTQVIIGTNAIHSVPVQAVAHKVMSFVIDAIGKAKMNAVPSMLTYRIKDESFVFSMVSQWMDIQYFEW